MAETKIINLSKNTASTVYKDGGLLVKGEKIKDFIIESKIDSSSGEAEIYKCKNKTGELFALKYYFTKKPNTDNQEVLVKYHHEDILSLVDYGEYKGLFYEVSEYAAGGSLADKTSTGEYRYLPMDYKTCNQILKETINAFNTFHSDGIIHRDIKPENLFYRNENGTDLVVGDFGISSTILDGETKHLTQTTSSGTVGFIAPEVSSGVIGKEIDYYALGITVWVLLTGQEPFLNEKGNIMNDGQILLDSLQGKTVDKLLSRTPQMDERYKNLIRGLLTVRHDKRWGYKEIQDFLDGREPAIFEEKFDWPPFEFNGKNYYTLDEISDALLTYRDAAVDVIFGKDRTLSYYLRMNDKSGDLYNKIENLVDEYSVNHNEKEGIVHIAYSLCPGREFYLGEWGKSESISTVKDMVDILKSNPKLLLNHLTNSDDDFYIYLEAAGLEEISDRIKKIMEDHNDFFMLKNRIIIALEGNRLKPFSDGINDNVELIQLEHLYNLPDYLKERIMMMIYQKNGFLCAWIENLSEYRISNFINTINIFPANFITGWGTFETFKDYLSGKKIIACAVQKQKNNQDILSLVQSLREEKNFSTMNLVIDNVWEYFFNENQNLSKTEKYDMVIKLLINIRMDKQENLSHDFCYYKAIIASCYNYLGVSGSSHTDDRDRDLSGHFLSGQTYDKELSKNAADYYDDAITLGEENNKCEGWFYLESGNLAYYCGDYIKALDLYKKALEYEPDNKWHWNKLGLIFDALGDYKQAVSAFETAIEKGKENGIYENLADAYECLTPPLYDKANEIRARIR